jgi:hypothetical protein
MIWPNLHSNLICLAFFFESMFSCFACFSNLEAVDSVSFFKTLKTTKNIITVGTLKPCSIQEQLEEQLMTITYGPT